MEPILSEGQRRRENSGWHRERTKRPVGHSEEVALFPIADEEGIVGVVQRLQSPERISIFGLGARETRLMSPSSGSLGLSYALRLSQRILAPGPGLLLANDRPERTGRNPAEDAQRETASRLCRKVALIYRDASSEFEALSAREPGQTGRLFWPRQVTVKHLRMPIVEARREHPSRSEC